MTLLDASERTPSTTKHLPISHIAIYNGLPHLTSDMPQQNPSTKLQYLQRLIDEGDAAIAAGQVKTYETPAELVHEVIRRSKQGNS